MRLNINTPLKFYTPINAYEEEQGVTQQWVTLTSKFDNANVDIFWTEWQSAFGNQVLEAQAIGVEELATIRMPYNPVIYNALRSNVVVVARNGTDIMIDNAPDFKNSDCYMAFGGVDNFKELNQVLEFKVRRYEQK